MLPAIDQTGLDGIALELARQTDTIAAAFELVRSLDAPAELALSSPRAYCSQGALRSRRACRLPGRPASC
jgi:hypothetical protein